MQRQRWRGLWLWFGVLVAGGGQLWSSDQTPPPAPEPTLPLWGYTLLPPSLTPPVWPLNTVVPVDTLSPVIFYLNVTGPVCYETSVGSLVCLGQVYNAMPSPVEQVTVVVQLLANNGQVLASGETQVARAVIPPGAAGPYRVLFDQIPRNYARQYAYVKNGLERSNLTQDYANLSLSRVSGTFVLDQYQVSLSIVNRSQQPANRIVVTMTLLDREGQVTGFREVMLDPNQQLAPGESLALTIKVIPQGEDTVGFDAFAEGRLVSLN